MWSYHYDIKEVRENPFGDHLNKGVTTVDGKYFLKDTPLLDVLTF